MRRVLNRLFYLAMAVVWLVVIALGLEAYERGRALTAEWLYQKYAEQQNRKVYRMVPANELAKPVNQFALKVAASLPPSSSSPVPAPQAPQTPDDVKRAREAFAAQSDENRNIIAALQGELVIRFNRTGAYVSSWGEPSLQQYLMPYVSQNIDISMALPMPRPCSALVAAGTPQHFELDRLEGNSGQREYYEMFVTPRSTAAGEPDGAEVLIRATTDTKPPELLSPATTASEDSAWEIPLFRYKRNYHTENSGTAYNNFGFRDRDVVVPKPKGLYRIVCVGGSTTEEGNTNETTYPHILDQKLKAKYGETAVEVINCGICGIKTYGERRRIADYLALEPDLILFYEGVNDITHAHFPIWTDRVESWKKTLRHSAFLDRWINRALLPSDDELAAFMNATTFRNFAAMLYAARERGVDVAFCSFAYPTVHWWNFRDRNYLEINMKKTWDGRHVRFPTYCRIMDLHNRLTKEFCERERLLYIPVAENVHAGMDHFFDVCHVTPIGLELKTNVIAAYLEPYLKEKHVGTAPAAP